jgi:hypothetical protein
MGARWPIGTCLASALAVAGSAWADPLPEHRWSLRGNFGVNTSEDPLPGDAFLAVSLARRFGSRFGVEGFVGPGLPVTTLAKDGRGGERRVDLDSGVHAAALLRLEHPLTSSGRALLTFAGGPSLVSGDVFGTVPMARVEGGFDWRFARSKVVSLSIGYESVLRTSRSPIEAADCLHASRCPPYYKKGSGQVSARWGFGFTF